MFNKRWIKARLQYLQRSYNAWGSDIKGQLVCFTLAVFFFCLNDKIHLSLSNANNSESFKRKMV